MHEKAALLQLQRAPPHALPSVVQVQLTTSRSAWGATGPVEMAGLMVAPSILQPKLSISPASSGGSRWSACFPVASNGELGAHAAAQKL